MSIDEIGDANDSHDADAGGQWDAVVARIVGGSAT